MDENLKQGVFCYSTNSPVKVFREPDAEESPQKQVPKKEKINYEIFGNVKVRRVENYSYLRGQSHLSARVKEPENEDKIFRKKWVDGIEKGGVRSASRETTAKNVWKDSGDKEIQQLKSKIKNLIRENTELITQVETQNKHLKVIANKEKAFTGKGLGVSDGLDNSLLEVTFKSKEFWEENVRQHQRFPREVFRLPKGKPRRDKLINNN